MTGDVRTDVRMHFASDNAAGAAPEILAAVAGASDGYALAYGNDSLTQAVERQFCELFEREVAVFLVATGTAANALAVAHFCEPWSAVLCHAQSHLATDEAGAPEFFGGGVKLIELPGANGKIDPDGLRQGLARGRGAPHSVLPAVLSLSQSTEVGTIYRLDELRALAEISRAGGLALHIDGARFANALVALDCSPAEATWKSGVDVLSFGATKNGAIAAEAVIFFDPARANGMASRRKRGGHLLSKHRFIAAQFEAYLRDGLWLDLARKANAAAARLARELATAGLPPVWTVEANEVFVVLDATLDRRLRSAGAAYYAWPADAMPESQTPPAGAVLARLVTSFTTSDADVAAFMRLVRAG